MPTRSQIKRAERAEKFRKLGEAISKLKPYYIDYDYHTGRESNFHLGRRDDMHRDYIHESQGIEFCPWPKDRCEIHFGPVFKTPQWDRTVGRA